MATLEQEATLTQSGDEEQHRPGVDSVMQRIPLEEWRKMTRVQRKNIIRRRNKALGAAGPSGEHPGTSRGKRPRESTGLNPSPKGARKKPRTERQDYSAALSGLRVAIRNVEYPEGAMNEEFIEKLQIALMDKMMDIKPEGEELISFQGIKVREGALVINCSNNRSKEWLEEEVRGLTPFDGIHLETCDPGLLEGFQRIGVHIPKPIRSVENILKTIQVLNGLDTSRWRILPGGAKELPSGMYIAASIPDSHLKVIEKRGGKICHGFHTVEVRIKKKKEDAPEKTETEGRQEERRGGEGGRGAVSGVGEVRPGQPVKAMRECREDVGDGRTASGGRPPKRPTSDPQAKDGRTVASPAVGAGAETKGRVALSKGALAKDPLPPS